MKERLGNFIKIQTGKKDANAAKAEGKYPFFTCAVEPLKINTYSYNCECVLVAGNGDLNVKYYFGKFEAYQRTYIIESSCPDKLLVPYLYRYLSNYIVFLRRQSIGGVIKYIKLNNLTEAQIPLPDIKIQKKIVDEFDCLDRILDKRKKQLEDLDLLVNSRFMEMFGNVVLNEKCWDVKPLLKLSSLITNGNTPAGGSENYVSTGVMFLRSQNIWRKRLDLKDIVFIEEKTHEKMKRSSLRNKDILITKTGRINTENSSLGRAAIFYGKNDIANINGHVYLVRLKEGVLPEFVLEILTSEEYRDYIRKVCVGGIDKRQINLEHVEQFPIILPPIDLQNEFVCFMTQIDKSKF